MSFLSARHVRLAVLALAASCVVSAGFALSVLPLAAQSPRSAQNTFAGVTYDSGDIGSSQKAAHTGWIVLGDSGVECHPADARPFVRSVGDKLALGILASERRDEMVPLSYAESTGAEAPVFVTRERDSARLLAQLRFRLKALGLPTHRPAADTPGVVDSGGGA